MGDRLAPRQHLKIAELGVAELGTARQQLLLLRVIGAGQRLVGAGHVEHRQPVGARARAESGDVVSPGVEVQALLDGGGVHQRLSTCRLARYLRFNDASGEVQVGLAPVESRQTALGMQLHAGVRVSSAEEVWLPDIHSHTTSVEFATVGIVTVNEGGFVPWMKREGVLQKYSPLVLKGSTSAIEWAQQPDYDVRGSYDQRVHIGEIGACRHEHGALSSGDLISVSAKKPTRRHRGRVRRLRTQDHRYTGAARSNQRVSRVSMTRPKLLLVDDAPENIRLLEAVLVPRGYDVVAANSGENTLRNVPAPPRTS